jgi:hypothetical protein
VASEPVVRPTRRQTRLRRGLRRFSQGLIVFGIAGLVISAFGLGTLLWTSATFGSFGTRVGDESTQLAQTLRNTAGTLHDASRSALSFGRTLDETEPSVAQAAQTIRNMRPRLEALEVQSTSLDIFGARPLQGIGQLFGQMADDLDGLDTQLDEISAGLGGNRSALDANARSLNGLGNELIAVAQRIEEGLVTETLADAQSILAAVLAIMVAWMAVPAAGAIAFGVWLRRELDLGLVAGPPEVVARP